jgi:uncharacterized protein (TIGR03067 family)
VYKTKEQWTFSGDKVKGRAMGKEFVAEFRIDETQEPHFIDLTNQSGDTAKGAYRIDGDSLTLLFGGESRPRLPVGESRPRPLVTDKYSALGIIGYGFKRAKQ